MYLCGIYVNFYYLYNFYSILYSLIIVEILILLFMVGYY